MRGHESLVRLIGKRRRDVTLGASTMDSQCCEHSDSSNGQLDRCGTRKKCKQMTLPWFSSREPPGNSGSVHKRYGHEAESSTSASVQQVEADVNCLRTHIVGRKFRATARCEPGMEVILKREPDNIHDANAVQVLSATREDETLLGYIPRFIASHISRLLECDKLQITGHITFVSRTTNLSLRLKGTTDECLLQKWQTALDAVDPAIGREDNFLYVLDTVLQRDGHLFSNEENAFLVQFKQVSTPGQALFLRLSQRKGPWFRLLDISYNEIPDVEDAVEELAAIGFLNLVDRHMFDAYPDAVLEVLDALNVQELRQLIHMNHIMKKADAVAANKNALKKSIHAAASNLKLMNIIFAQLAKMVGHLVQVSEKSAFLLWRLQRLFFLNGEQDLQVFLLTDIGKRKFPAYRCTRTCSVFPTRETLLDYERALQLAQVADMALEANDLVALYESVDIAQRELEKSKPSQQLEFRFLSRFTAPWVYATICTLAVSLHERERRYEDAVRLLQKLLSINCCPARRGFWTLRLSIDLEHLGRPERSLQVAEDGLSDTHIRSGDRVALQRRVLRLGKPPRRWKVPAFAEKLKRTHKMVEIVGRPLGTAVGVKSRFYGYDGQQCGVEELALQYYAAEEGGGWEGVHSESGIWLTLFGLLMWDIVFSDVDDVFQTPFQTAPLDLDTDAFYPAREVLIESRLEVIRLGSACDIISETWSQHHGTLCRGVNWERYTLEGMLAIAGCIGGSGLAAICKLFAEDYGSWTAGMPDLLLWRTSDGQAKLAEVKGPGDRLSEQQTAWFLVLADSGLQVEVCKVVIAKKAKNTKNSKNRQ